MIAELPAHLPFLVIVMAPSTQAYDSLDWCQQLMNTSTDTHPVWDRISCPSQEMPPGHRVPAYCCGTDWHKECCEWSIFLINSAGFGHTSLGLFFFVCLSFVAALLVVVVCCGFFHLCCVLRWRQNEVHHERSRPGSSRHSSFRPNRRGGSIDTIHSVTMLHGESPAAVVV
ncbi:hypothetical protein BV898_11642 [Hypsibius exemplaris]|uniref:Uncharacterized protein n=1 Tax=Hypsibius exemplaris TaxID=2072580 RepID=A0A1W0WG44_HYPEX|nr:hypothetical protein BV898_11642 [Hypsibius exemplaris]